MRIATEGVNDKKARRKKESPTGQGGASTQNIKLPESFDDLLSEIKTILLSGQSLRIVDFPVSQRPSVIGALATLADQLPIRRRWVTLSETHLAEVRVRARAYQIPGEFLRTDGRER